MLLVVIALVPCLAIRVTQQYHSQSNIVLRAGAALIKPCFQPFTDPCDCQYFTDLCCSQSWCTRSSPASGRPPQAQLFPPQEQQHLWNWRRRLPRVDHWCYRRGHWYRPRLSTAGAARLAGDETRTRQTRKKKERVTL